jgi:hypothetical protein
MDNRQWEINLARIRIGHTHLTHSYLMEGGVMPYCGDYCSPQHKTHSY